MARPYLRSIPAATSSPPRPADFGKTLGKPGARVVSGFFYFDAQLLVRGSKGSFIEIEIPAANGALRQLRMAATKAPDFGILSITVNGKAAAAFDAYSSSVVHADEVTLGTFTPVDGKYIVKIEVNETNAATTGPRYYFGIDYFRLEKP